MPRGALFVLLIICSGAAVGPTSPPTTFASRPTATAPQLHATSGEGWHQNGRAREQREPRLLPAKAEGEEEGDDGEEEVRLHVKVERAYVTGSRGGGVSLSLREEVLPTRGAVWTARLCTTTSAHARLHARSPRLANEWRGARVWEVKYEDGGEG